MTRKLVALVVALMLPLALAGHAAASIRIPVEPPPARCVCRPEVEVPAMGWRLGPEAIDTSAWTREPPKST